MTLPSPDTKVPAAQRVNGEQAAASVLVEYVPGAQESQRWSAVAVPRSATKVPAVQLVHAVQELALAVVLYRRAGHAAHTRSLAAVPAALTSVPGGQVDQGEHAARFGDAVYVPAVQALQR
jgi:hypothetical protein